MHAQEQVFCHLCWPSNFDFGHTIGKMCRFLKNVYFCVPKKRTCRFRMTQGWTNDGLTSILCKGWNILHNTLRIIHLATLWMVWVKNWSSYTNMSDYHTLPDFQVVLNTISCRTICLVARRLMKNNIVKSAQNIDLLQLDGIIVWR